MSTLEGPESMKTGTYSGTSCLGSALRAWAKPAKEITMGWFRDRETARMLTRRPLKVYRGDRKEAGNVEETRFAKLAPSLGSSAAALILVDGSIHSRRFSLLGYCDSTMRFSTTPLRCCLPRKRFCARYVFARAPRDAAHSISHDT